MVGVSYKVSNLINSFEAIHVIIDNLEVVNWLSGEWKTEIPFINTMIRRIFKIAINFENRMQQAL